MSGAGWLCTLQGEGAGCWSVLVVKDQEYITFPDGHLKGSRCYTMRVWFCLGGNPVQIDVEGEGTD